MKELEESPVALVTGASSGFGRRIVLRLAGAGYRVVATVRDVSKVEMLRMEAAGLGLADQIDWVLLDVTRVEEVRKVVAELGARYHHVDVLVNNAGIAVGGFTEEVALEDWRKQMETNFFAVVHLTQAVLPLMRKQHQGKIIQMSSISGQVGFPGLGPYAASKFALEGFSESLRLELRAHGIYVVLIEPGSYRTDIWDKSLASLLQNDSSPYRSQMERLLQFTRSSAEGAGDPGEVADLVLHVARHPSPRLRYSIGKGVRLTLLLKAWLPWHWIEALMGRRLK